MRCDDRARGIASAEEDAQATINRLQDEGYTVNIDRIGSAPMSECVVTNVRNPKTVQQWVPYLGPGPRPRRRPRAGAGN